MFACSHLAGFSNVNHHRRRFKLDDERARGEGPAFLHGHLNKRVDELVDSGKSLLSPGHGLLDGGTVRMERPASVLKFIFLHDNFENVASGPTYKDVSTVADAQKIITEHNL